MLNCGVPITPVLEPDALNKVELKVVKSLRVEEVLDPSKQGFLALPYICVYIVCET